jgi:hypothetical protein
MNKNIFILSIVIVIVVVALVFWVINNPPENNIFDENKSNDNGTSDDSVEDNDSNDNFLEMITPVVSFEKDKYNKTITIISIENGTDLYWNNVELVSGTAVLPNGTIDVGDIITECIGILDFNWKPTNEIFLHCEFLRGDE